MPAKRKAPATAGGSSPPSANKKARQMKLEESIRGVPIKSEPKAASPTTNSGHLADIPAIKKHDSHSPTREDLPGGPAIKTEVPAAASSSLPPLIDHNYYPPELSNARCEEYISGKRPRPLEVLQTTLEETRAGRAGIKPGRCVVHWFKRDLRLHDNRALAAASTRARGAGIPLVCIYLVSAGDWEAFGTSPARVDFVLRSLRILQEDLKERGIPLVVQTVEDRKLVGRKVIELCHAWGAKQVFCNIEYEVDELRREARLVKACLREGIAFDALHDDCVVPPGRLQTGNGKQFAVYTPWYRAWCKFLHAEPKFLQESKEPEKNPGSAKEEFAELFDDPKYTEIPPAPPGKALEKDQAARFAQLWPAGEHEGLARLDKFIKEKIPKYKDTRDVPAAHGVASLSAHFAAGTLSARTAIRRARDANSTKSLDGGNAGIACWISEVAWRDFYKHVLAHWPFVCMNKPFKYASTTTIAWEEGKAAEENFRRWCTGTTGFPFVDAAMRNLVQDAWMPNRARMVVASFLAKDLLIDWRRGEQHFMRHLIDGDLASNSGGWGFSASVGVDPQPYFRIFNPLLQSEKFDPDGEYIRQWVPELRDVKGKAIHDPYGRGSGAIAKKNGYPKPCVEHAVMRKLALERYKSGLGAPGAAEGKEAVSVGGKGK